jgi:hypothetical protein
MKIATLLNRSIVGLMMSMVASVALAQTSSAPDELIRTVTQGVLDQIKSDRSIQTGNIERLNTLVDQKVMPYVNFQRMTALAVGRNWRAATPDQQQQLMNEFRRLLLLTYADDCSRYGSVAIGEDCGISSFIEKSATAGRGLINAGVYLINCSLIREIPPGRVLSLEKDIFPGWIGRRFFGHASARPTFIDIGTPQSLRQAQALFESRRSS